MKKNILIFIALLIMSCDAIAQTIATNESKIIVVVNKAENTIDKLLHYNTFNELSTLEIEKKYPKSNFYLGLLKGKYRITNDEIELGKAATLTIYANKKYYPKDDKLSSKDIKIGKTIQIGNTKTIVVTNKDGEIILTTTQ